MHEALRDASRARCTAERINAASTPMIAIVTSSSMSVNALRSMSVIDNDEPCDDRQLAVL